MRTLLYLCLCAAAVPPAAASAQSTVVRPGYADLVDLTQGAPIIIDAAIRSAARIKGLEAAGVAPGATRFYVEADVGALLRGPGGVPPRVRYLVDVLPDADGRVPNLKRRRVLLFARSAGADPSQLQLVAPDAQVDWTPENDARVRAIATALLASDSPPRIVGVGNAFHVAGTLPGEGETQIFLATADNRPISLSVIRRPGERPRWAVALSEIVDEAAAPPAPDTLLRYRLACELPATLPVRSTSTLGDADAAQARADYGFVRDSIGPCGRTRGANPPGGVIADGG